MGYMVFNFRCKTCGHEFDSLVYKEYGKDEHEMGECPNGKNHEVENAPTAFSGVYDVGFYGKSKRMKNR